mgnify:CR=1 FL=1
MNPSIGLKRRMSVWLMTVHAACENGVPLGGTPFFHVCHMPSGRVGDRGLRVFLPGAHARLDHVDHVVAQLLAL